MGITRISFSLLLPIVELVFWVALVPTEVGLIHYRAGQATHASGNISARLGEVELKLPPDRLATFSLRWMPLRYSHAIIAANLPGLVADLLVSLPTAQPGTWHPSGVSLDNWRCFTLPFYCLPAWWFVGCGLDGLLGRRRLRRAMLWVGSIFCLLFVVIMFGYYTSSPGDQADLRWLLPGFWLWILLFGSVPLNWLQKENARASRTAGQP